MKGPAASKTQMEEYQELFLQALSCAVSGGSVPWTEPVASRLRRRILRLAEEQAVLPLVVDSVLSSGVEEPERWMRMSARTLTLSQAARTAEFLLLYDALQRRGLRPAVLKGIICRSLYPEPEQRPSTDEDLLIAPEELPEYHEVLLELGLKRINPFASADGEYEITYVDEARGIYLEVHTHLFSPKSGAYGDCCRLFEGALDRTVDLQISGTGFRTLGETDHLLFLLCHAYKHFLHGGVGIRQICDACLFAQRYGDRVDWDRLLAGCREIRIELFSAALFRIGEHSLSIPAPAAFSAFEIDELPLLDDCLAGGVYGADDPNHSHSSTLMLESVASQKEGRRSRGVLGSVFLPASRLADRYPYLDRHPWLLPAAWVQRVWRFLFREGSHPGDAVRISYERAALLKQYGILR